MANSFRKYNARKDKKSVHRIWQECGWITEEKREIEALDRFLKSSSGWVFDINGSAERLSLCTRGRFLRTKTELSLAAITAVNTSRVARNQRAASGTVPTNTRCDLTSCRPKSPNRRWRGCGGDYTVAFGSPSSARRGHAPDLPSLSATVNDFTRLWIGAAGAEVLAGVGSFDGPADLMIALDESLQLPSPDPHWDYRRDGGDGGGIRSATVHCNQELS